jgi:hypothetical protein
MPSPSQTLRSWVRIPLEAWFSVRVYSVFVWSCVDSGLATADNPTNESYQLSVKIHCSRFTLMGNRPEGLIRKAEDVVARGTVPKQ